MIRESCYIFFAFVLSLIFSSCQGSSEFPENGLAFNLEQRNDTSFVINGSDLLIRIGDITKGRVLLVLESSNEQIGGNFIAAGDVLEFELGSEKYSLECLELDNQLIGSDTGTFRIRKMNSGSAEDQNKSDREIVELLKQIEISGYTFIRNGERYSSGEAAEHLRRKYNEVKGEIKSKDQFIDEIASRSSMTGEYYYLEITADSTVKLSDWLRGM